MKKRVPNIGDRVITDDGRRGVLTLERPVGDPRWETVVRLEEGGVLSVDLEHLRRETFLQFITRPTGFGLTRWPAFAAIFLGFAMCITVGCISPEVGAKWLCLGIGTAIAAVTMRGTWRNYTGRQG